jgi:hypothetical protein
MSDDYLWDRSGKPDPEVQKLEEMLGQFRHDVPAPDFSQATGVVREFPRRRWVRWMAIAAAAAIVLLVTNVWFQHRPGPAALYVARIAGAPQVDAKPIKGTDTLAVGQYLVTDEKSRARIDVGLIGEVEVEPNSRIGLLATRITEHRLALDVGRMHARIWAPPGLFFVETPSATAIDLGCRYTLTVDKSGAGFLHVTLGQVAFEWKGRESFVPAGAMCQTRPGIGPGTPYREDAPEALRSALAEFDFELGGIAGGVEGGVKGGVQGGVSGGVAGGVKGGVEGGIAGGVEGLKKRRAETLKTVLERARKEDALTLWHLLTRTSDEERARVYDRLAALVPPREGITREGVIASHRQMLDQWWVQISGRRAPMAWWRMWKGPAPQVP